jgi:hypothetical protein
MALQRTRRPRVPKQQIGFGAGGAVQGLAGTGGSPLNARPFGVGRKRSALNLLAWME